MSTSNSNTDREIACYRDRGKVLALKLDRKNINFKSSNSWILTFFF